MWLGRLKGISLDELQLVQKVSRICQRFASLLDPTNAYGLGSGKDGIASSLYALRASQALTPPGGRILELGPGNGYHSALAALSGFRLDTLELSQAFYAYQFGLFLVLEEETHDESNPRLTPPSQIFIWDFIDESYKFSDSYDLVIANHMLSEMHPHSLRFILAKIIIESKRLGKPVPTFAAESLGGGSDSDKRRALDVFTDFDFFCLTLNDLFVFSYKPDEGRINELKTLIPSVFKPRLEPVNLEDVLNAFAARPNDTSPDERFWRFINVAH